MKIVVAFDGSEQAHLALHAALNLASKMHEPVQVHVVSVVDYATLPLGLSDGPAGAPDLLATDAETELQVAREIAQSGNHPIVASLLRGRAADEILNYARGIGADMIAVGTHGRKGIQRALVGSTCEALVRQSDIPVLSVHSAARAHTAIQDAAGSPAKAL